MSRLINSRIVSILASAALLGGVAAEKVSLRPPADAVPYHRRVLEASAALPMNFGDWSGETVAEPYDVVKVLQPNVLITRRFHGGDRQFWFVIVQCADSRTLVGHYPLVCYVDMGNTLVSSTPMDWPVDDFTVTGTEYVFAAVAFDPSTAIVVDNFMVLPDGRFTRDMGPVFEDALNVRMRGFGAAEVQFVFEPGFKLTERSKIITDYLKAARRLISAIRSGPGSLCH